MSDGYTALDQKPFISDYTYASVIIDHPVEKVWPYALDLPAWMSANHEWEPVSGEPGKDGYFWRIWPRKHYIPDDDIPPPLYHVIGLPKVIERKLIAVEVFPEKGGSYGDRFMPEDDRGFGPLLFTDLGDKTSITILNIHTADREPDQEHPVPIPDEEKAKNFVLHFDNLKKLIDGVPLDTPATDSFWPR